MMLKPIPGFPNYKINRAGQLFSVKSKKFVKEKPGGLKRYPRYELWHEGKRFHKWIHRLVCAIWVGPVEGMEVHHRDGDVLNFHADNLVPLTHEDHLKATAKLRAKKAREAAEKAKQDCPF